jgi:hypothetical protein
MSNMNMEVIIRLAISATSTLLADSLIRFTALLNVSKMGVARSGGFSDKGCMV